MVLDIERFRDDPESIRENQKLRFKNTDNVDKVLEADEVMRGIKHLIEQWNKIKNTCGQEIAKKLKANKSIDEEDELPESISSSLSTIDSDVLHPLTASQIKKICSLIDEEADNCHRQLKSYEDLRTSYQKEIGNWLHESVPISLDEEENLIVKTWGDITSKKEFSNVNLLQMIGGIDQQKGKMISGDRAYYLKDSAVFLEQGLIQLALRMLYERKYQPIYTPCFVRRTIMDEIDITSEYKNVLYEARGPEEKNELKYLIPSSELPLAAYHRKEGIPLEKLPLRYAGVSNCFRPEHDRIGQETRGIFRVNQFNKVEQFVLTSPFNNTSWNMFEEILKNAEDFLQLLEIPYRLQNVVSGALDLSASKKIDIQAWFPGSNKFLELVSCTNTLDFQARQLDIRCGPTKSKGCDYCHMMNSTMCATTRVICAILEHNQTETGITVPEALKPFMPENLREEIPYLKN